MMKSVGAIRPVIKLSEEISKNSNEILNQIFTKVVPDRSKKNDDRYVEIKFISDYNQLKKETTPQSKLLYTLYNLFKNDLKIDDECKIKGTIGCYLRTAGLRVPPFEDNYVTRVIFNFGCNEIYCFSKEGDRYRDGSHIFFGKDSYMIAPMSNRNILVSKIPRNVVSDMTDDGRFIEKPVLRSKLYKRYTIIIDIEKPGTDSTTENIEILRNVLSDNFDLVMKTKNITKNKRKKKKDINKLQQLVENQLGVNNSDNDIPLATDEQINELVNESIDDGKDQEYDKLNDIKSLLDEIDD